MPSLSWFSGSADAKVQPKPAAAPVVSVVPEGIPLDDARAMWEAMDQGNQKKRPAQMFTEDMSMLFEDSNPAKPATAPTAPPEPEPTPEPTREPFEPARMPTPYPSFATAPAMTSSSAPIMITQEQLAMLLNPMVVRQNSPTMPPPSFPYGYTPLPVQAGEPRPANVRRIISGDELDQHVPPPQNEIKYAATANGDECRRKIEARERLRNRDFSSEKILADKVALARLETTVPKLLKQYYQELARQQELESYRADWDYCDDMRTKATFADKMYKGSLDAKNEKLAKVQAEEDMCDDEEKHDEPDPSQFSTAPMQFSENRELKPLWDQFMAQQKMLLESARPQPMQESSTRKPKTARTTLKKGSAV